MENLTKKQQEELLKVLQKVKKDQYNLIVIPPSEGEIVEHRKEARKPEEAITLLQGQLVTGMALKYASSKNTSDTSDTLAVEATQFILGKAEEALVEAAKMAAIKLLTNLENSPKDSWLIKSLEKIFGQLMGLERIVMDVEEEDTKAEEKERIEDVLNRLH